MGNLGVDPDLPPKMCAGLAEDAGEETLRESGAAEEGPLPAAAFHRCRKLLLHSSGTCVQTMTGKQVCILHFHWHIYIVLLIVDDLYLNFFSLQTTKIQFL